MKCAFCEIVNNIASAYVVYEDGKSLAFLDSRPVFPGHVLLVPKQHVETLADLPGESLEPLFRAAQRLERAVESAMKAQGSFVAMNNRVSQSVPHLHVHIVPRSKGDGLRGFFWPRSKYESTAQAEEIASRIREAVTE